MKTLILAAATLFIASTASSCKQCSVCTKANSPEVRFCEKDYDTKTEYAARVDAIELTGYDCKEAI